MIIFIWKHLQKHSEETALCYSQARIGPQLQMDASPIINSRRRQDWDSSHTILPTRALARQACLDLARRPKTERARRMIKRIGV